MDGWMGRWMDGWMDEWLELAASSTFLVVFRSGVVFSSKLCFLHKSTTLAHTHTKNRHNTHPKKKESATGFCLSLDGFSLEVYPCCGSDFVAVLWGSGGTV